MGKVSIYVAFWIMFAAWVMTAIFAAGMMFSPRIVVQVQQVPKAETIEIKECERKPWITPCLSCDSWGDSIMDGRSK